MIYPPHILFSSPRRRGYQTYGGSGVSAPVTKQELAEQPANDPCVPSNRLLWVFFVGCAVVLSVGLVMAGGFFN